MNSRKSLLSKDELDNSPPAYEEIIRYPPVVPPTAMGYQQALLHTSFESISGEAMAEGMDLICQLPTMHPYYMDNRPEVIEDKTHLPGGKPKTRDDGRMIVPPPMDVKSPGVAFYSEINLNYEHMPPSLKRHSIPTGKSIDNDYRTVHPCLDFCARTDASTLRKLIGCTYDVGGKRMDQILGLMLKRSRAQRHMIIDELDAQDNMKFFRMFREKDAKAFSCGFFSDKLTSDVNNLWIFMEARPPSVRGVCEIICTKSSQELAILMGNLWNRKKMNLISALRNKLDPKCYELLSTLLTTNREVHFIPDFNHCDQMLRTFSFDSSHCELIKFLCINSFQKLNELFNVHKIIYQSSFYEKHISPLKNGDFKDAITIIYDFAIDPTTCYFNIMMDSVNRRMIGMICRILLDRSEIDLNIILCRYDEQKMKSFKKILKIYIGDRQIMLKMAMGLCGF